MLHRLRLLGAAGIKPLRAEHKFPQLVFTSFPKSKYWNVLLVRSSQQKCKIQTEARAGVARLTLTPPAPPLELPGVSFLLYLFIYFPPVLFSQHCNASLDIIQASLSCSASAESNLGPRCNCQADKTFLLSFTLKRSFPPPLHLTYTRRPNC